MLFCHVSLWNDKRKINQYRFKKHKADIFDFVLTSFIAALNQLRLLFKQALNREKDAGLFSKHKRFISSLQKKLKYDTGL